MRLLLNLAPLALLTVALPTTALAITTGAPGGGTDVVINDADYGSVCHVKIAPGPTTDGDPRDPFPCSCVLVGDDIVVTAAKCVKLSDEVADIALPGNIEAVTFGASVSTGDAYNVVSIEVHRYYKAEGGNDLYGLAMLRLDAKPTDDGWPIADLLKRGDATPQVGDILVLAGYGNPSDENRLTDGQRQGTSVEVRAVNFDHYLAGLDKETTCRGDGGGGTFWDHDNDDATPPKLVAFHSYTPICFNNTKRLRSDFFADNWIFPYVDSYNGPCASGGGCVTGGCRTPDPDCAGNECNWRNGCEENCPTRDWDCEIGVYAGFGCDADGQCEEGGRCITAVDDTTFTYCSRTCDEAGEVYRGCPENMTCGDNGGTVECAYGTPSRGSQGWACGLNEECRSGLCEGGVCVFDCVPGQTLCADGFTCAASTLDGNRTVCRAANLSGGGGFCAVTESGGNRDGFLLLFGLCVLGLVLSRRRSA